MHEDGRQALRVPQSRTQGPEGDVELRESNLGEPIKVPVFEKLDIHGESA